MNEVSVLLSVVLMALRGDTGALDVENGTLVLSRARVAQWADGFSLPRPVLPGSAFASCRAPLGSGWEQVCSLLL